MAIIRKKRRQMIAKTANDVAKTIFAIGLVSHFFKDFSFTLRGILAVSCIVLFLVSFFVEPEE